MYILGYEIDIYLVLVVIAGIFVLSIIVMICSSMMPKKHVSKSKKEKKGRSELIETYQSKDKNKPQAKPQQYPQDKVPEGPQKELSIKLSEESQNNSAIQTKNLPDTEKGTPDGADVVKSQSQLSRLWEPQNTQEAKEEPEVTESGDALMDVFSDTNDTEDPDLSDLAEGLVDVNLDTLKKLGEELSQVLSKSGSV